MSALSRVCPAAKFLFVGDHKFFVKGVTYGPFKPDEQEHYLGRPAQVDVDLAMMREIGINVVRIYHAPPRWFLDCCAAAGMRVLITLPWAKLCDVGPKPSANSATNKTIPSFFIV